MSFNEGDNQGVEGEVQGEDQEVQGALGSQSLASLALELFETDKVTSSYSSFDLFDSHGSHFGELFLFSAAFDLKFSKFGHSIPQQWYQSLLCNRQVDNRDIEFIKNVSLLFIEYWIV
jgi:hypothetical protein